MNNKTESDVKNAKTKIKKYNRLRKSVQNKQE